MFLGRETVQREEAVATAAIVKDKRDAASAVVSVATSSVTAVRCAVNVLTAAPAATHMTHAEGETIEARGVSIIDAVTVVVTRLIAVRVAATVVVATTDVVGVRETWVAAHHPTVGRGVLGMLEADHLPIVSREVRRMWAAAHQPTVSREAQVQGTIADLTALVAAHQLTDEAQVHHIHLALTTDREALVACNREDQDMMFQIEVVHPVPVAVPT